MKVIGMIDFKTYKNVDLKICKKTFCKKICHSIKELALIGGLNGSVSGAIAAVLAAYGYIALPGFGPIIAMGVGIASLIGIIIGATIGSIMGILVGMCCVFIETLYVS
ncbi:hypothetical protein [Bartonella sp. B30(2025)]